MALSRWPLDLSWFPWHLIQIHLEDQRSGQLVSRGSTRYLSMTWTAGAVPRPSSNPFEQCSRTMVIFLNALTGGPAAIVTITPIWIKCISIIWSFAIGWWPLWPCIAGRSWLPFEFKKSICIICLNIYNIIYFILGDANRKDYFFKYNGSTGDQNSQNAHLVDQGE